MGAFRPAPLVLAFAIATSPGCASAIAGALGASGSSASAANELDRAMIQAAIDGLTSGGARSTSRGPAPAASSAHFGGEPSYLCEVPGDPQRQRLAASSLAGALASCEAMNELPPGGACRCDEVEDGAALADPLAAR